MHTYNAHRFACQTAIPLGNRGTKRIHCLLYVMYHDRSLNDEDAQKSSQACLLRGVLIRRSADPPIHLACPVSPPFQSSGRFFFSAALPAATTVSSPLPRTGFRWMP